jgi:hypothetical protein
LKSKLKQLLKSATKDQLIAMVHGAYGLADEVDHLIESQLLVDDTKAKAETIKNRIEQVEQDTKFIDYHQNDDFCRVLDGIVRDIDSMVLPDPNLAFRSADHFMSTHGKVFDRVDDSYGEVGACYANGVSLWLKAASTWRKQDNDCSLDWSAAVFEHHYYNNDYGMWDSLIANCTDLLSTEELHQLAAKFAAKANQAKSGDKHTAISGLSAVAECLADVALYEKAL